MATVRPFKALRPKPDLAQLVAARPYDVMSWKEARETAKANPNSFLFVTRSDLEFEEESDHYSEAVYKRAAENLARFKHEGVLIQEPAPVFFIYRLQMGAHSQTGVVGVFSIPEYRRGLIKVHEKTRPEKVEDRKRHIKRLRVQAEPVFLAHRSSPELNDLIAKAVSAPPLINIQSEGVLHQLWPVYSTGPLEQLFRKLPCTYIADGHHRMASAEAVSAELNGINDLPQRSSDFVLAATFGDDQLQILPYNRLLKELPFTTGALLENLSEHFEVQGAVSGRPEGKNRFGMFLDGQWYELTAKPSAQKGASVVDGLDVSILQDRVLAPLFGIEDPRTDKRIDFVGGILGPEALEAAVRSGSAKCGFSLHPISVDDFFTVADQGLVLPPKSTWFEPKLASGLFVYEFSD